MFFYLLSVVLLVGTVLATPGTDPWARDTLKAHNILRAKHGSPPLKYDDRIAEYAQYWAQNLTSRGVFEHRTNNKYGENLFWGSSPAFTGKKATLSWYDEIKDYKNYKLDIFSPGNSVSIDKVGHFTQVVWRNCKYLGCGFSISSKGIVIVCNYDPPGNYVGQFVDNVLPRKPDH